MTIPKDIRKKVEKEIETYCEKRVPQEVRGQVQLAYKIRGNSIILFEKRPHYIEKQNIIEEPIAKIKYLSESNEWQLYYQNRNLRWSEYWDLGPEKNITILIQEIDTDPTGIFWG